MLVRDVSVVEDVDVDDVDGDGDDNEVDVEDWDEALVNDKFEEGGNLVDERNDAMGNDGNGVMEDVDYEWYNPDYDDPANEKLYEIIVDEVNGKTFQPFITRNGRLRWEVNSYGKQFAVEVEKRSYACNCWDLIGFPYKHIVHATNTEEHFMGFRVQADDSFSS
nr:hypothetical protein CFP56_51055 [Quercus suber]